MSATPPVEAPPGPRERRVAYSEAGAALFRLARQLEGSVAWLARLPASTGRKALLRTLALQGRSSLSEIARARGVSRQGVQRLAELLERQGLVRVVADPRRRRAKVLELTQAGAKAYLELSRREAEALNTLAQGLTPGDLAIASRVLRVLGERTRAASPRSRAGTAEECSPS